MLNSKKITAVELSRVASFIPTFIGSAAFWSLYQQQFTVVPIYAEQQLDRTILGWEMPPNWVNSINPIFIIVLAPMFAALWQKLGTRQPSTPKKFAFANVAMGGAFLLFLPFANGADNSTPLLWMVLILLVFTIAELCLSPVGQSLSTKLAPDAFHTQMIALFFISVAVGSAASGWLARFYDPNNDLPYFLILAGLSILLGILIAVFNKKLSKLMAGVHCGGPSPGLLTPGCRPPPPQSANPHPLPPNAPPTAAERNVRYVSTDPIRTLSCVRRLGGRASARARAVELSPPIGPLHRCRTQLYGQCESVHWYLQLRSAVTGGAPGGEGRRCGPPRRRRGAADGAPPAARSARRPTTHAGQPAAPPTSAHPGRAHLPRRGHQVRQRRHHLGVAAGLQSAVGVDPQRAAADLLIGQTDQMRHLLGAGHPRGVDVVHARTEPAGELGGSKLRDDLHGRT